MRSKTGLLPNRLKFAALLLPAVLLQASCITQSLYVARGQVTDADGLSQEAVLYWHNSEGRLWFGRPWKGQRQNFVTLRYGCGLITPQFKEEAGTLLLRPSSSGMDRIVAQEVGDDVVSSTVVELAASSCGRVLNHAAVKELQPGATVALSILCKTCDRARLDCSAKADYPKAGRYALGPIEVKKKRFVWTRPKSAFDGAPEAPRLPCRTRPL